LTVSDTLEESSEDASFVALAEADAVGVGVALAVESELDEPPVRMPVMASPMLSSRPPLLADAEGVAVAVPPDEPLESADLLAEADGVGVAALSSEPESDEEVLPESAFASSVAVAEGVAVSLDESADSLALVDGVAEGPAVDSARAATQSLYSSAVRLFDVGEVVDPLSARAREDVKPIPTITAVGIATVAIALPAGMWSLVNSGFLGAACRGPVLTRDSSTSVPWVTSSAGTVPPVRPVVHRARS
jgi:hypothetical protein